MVNNVYSGIIYDVSALLLDSNGWTLKHRQIVMLQIFCGDKINEAYLFVWYEEYAVTPFIPFGKTEGHNSTFLTLLKIC